MPYQKPISRKKRSFKAFLKSRQENGPNRRRTEAATGPGRIANRADRKVESNDSPEIPERKGTP